MENSDATFEAFDGVELRLLNGRVVRCDALTVREAVRYLRMLSKIAEDPTAHDGFLHEFSVRVGLLEVQLCDLGLTVEGVNVGALTVAQGLDLADVVTAAAGPTYAKATAEAQVRILDEFPGALGISGSTEDVFAGARAFVQALYEKLYGMARDFSGHLAVSPPVKVFEMRGQSLLRDSTT